jgi:hypothetical protein
MYREVLGYPTYIIWPPAVVACVLLIDSWLTANRVRKVKSAYAPAFSETAR